MTHLTITTNPISSTYTMRTVKPRFKFETTAVSIHKFSFCERLKLLLGFNVRVATTIWSEHSAGKSECKTIVVLTDNLPTVARPVVVDKR